MKKQLLSLACMAALVPAVTVNAEQASLVEEWSAVHMDPNPNSYEGFGVGVKPCIRFGTALNGKIYVVNQETNHIAEVTKDGIVDRYALPEGMGEVNGTKGGATNKVADFYGTSLSRDDAGNFLVGHLFTYSQSACLWTAFNPATGDFRHFNTEADFANNNINPGRIDCVGRVLGDLFNEAVLYVAPASYSSNRPDDSDLTLYQRVQIVSFMGGGAIASSSFGPQLYMASANVSVCQPTFASYDEYTAYTRQQGKPAIDGCAFFSAAYGAASKLGETTDHWQMMNTFSNGAASVNLAAHGGGIGDIANNYSGCNGFDTFTLEGKRYYVLNYMPENGDLMNNQGGMDVAVFDEEGNVVATWENPAFKAPTSYGTIVAEPIDDTHASICVYHCTARLGGVAYGAGVAVGAAKLIFTAGEGGGIDVPQPEKMEGDGTQGNPYKIKNADHLCQMNELLIAQTPVYFELVDDIDMADVKDYIPACGADNSTYDRVIMFNGNGHVIKNFRQTRGASFYVSIFGVLSGEVKNLGIIDCDIDAGSDGAGVLAAYAGHSTSGYSAVIDNVYVIGSIKNSGSYIGGLIGTTGAANVKITNSYAQVNVTGTKGNAIAGGLVGRVNQPGLIISNCYASGDIKGGSTVGGICGGGSEVPVLTDVIAWNGKVDGGEGTTGAFCGSEATTTRCQAWNGMKINGAPVEGGVKAEDLMNTATSWEAYAPVELGGYPALLIQFQGGVEGIEIDAPAAENVAPVYYNLQGVQVVNPAHGLYIVKRGNKVTKEIIR